MSLLYRIERYMRRTGEGPSVVGRKALGDPNLVRNLRNGRELRASTAERLRRYLADWEARQA